jgi:energy-coupling factor transporter ATP-binding protein EcfA2
MLTAEGLVKAYGRRRALDDFTLHVAAGEITGLVGPNGAGKTTFVEIVTGLTRPDSGSVTIGADPPTRSALLTVVAARAAAGAAVVYTTHYLPELAELGATIAFAIAIVCWGLALLGLGAALGALLRSPSELNMAYDIGGVLLAALGGATVPQAELPGWVQAISPVSPGYWAMSALRSALLGQATGTLRAAGVLLMVALATGAFATWRISRGWPRSRLL